MWLLEQCIKRGYSDEIVTLFFLMEQVPAIDTTSFVRENMWRPICAFY